jgi:hypothetical protein
MRSVRVMTAALGAAFLAAFGTSALHSQTALNAVDQLNARLQSGAARLTFDGRGGYLRSVLDELKVPVESQMLVFSPTSLQARRINPRNPRAIFFNQSVQVGFVRDGELLELAVHDAQKGVLFYTLDQKSVEAPRFKETTICLNCHRQRDTTLGMPGILMLNTDMTTRAELFAAGTMIDHRTPFEQRWGGWYVTGSSGAARHNGNVIAAGAAPRELSSVEGLFDLDGYPSAQSDIAALMVFLHHTQMTNWIARIGWETQDAQSRRQALLAPAGEADRAAAQLRSVATEMVDYMLFVDEPRLNGGIRSLSGFVETFSAQAPRDRNGRSLYDLDLTRRLLRYPCTYLIYSPAFDALPAQTKTAVYERLWQVLSGQEDGARYRAALSQADRRAIVEILRDTKRDLPGYFDPARLLS